jgi:ATP-dependent RNA helicase DHX29
MAGKKKAKKAQSNPARGFATTSSAPKSKTESKVDVDSEPVTLPVLEPVKAEPATESVDKPRAAAALTELTPDQLEAQLDESELQTLLEKHREKAYRNASRFISRQKTERRLLRQSAEPLRLTTFISEDILECAFGHIQSGQFASLLGNSASTKSLASALPEEELCARVWALKQGLVGLNFAGDRIKDALIHSLSIKSLLETSRGASPKEMLWGADESLDYLALSSNVEDLPAYDNHRSGSPRKSAHGLDPRELQIQGGMTRFLCFQIVDRHGITKY